MAASQSLLLFMVMVTFFGMVRGTDFVIKPERTIAGGASIRIVEDEWMAAIFVKEKPHIQFGGSILNDYWILTAAHCTYKRPLSTFTVLVGTLSLNNGGHNHSVDKVVEHEQYEDGTYLNDISVMRTKSRMNFDGNQARAVTLPAPGAARPPVGTTLTVSGWGKMEDGTFPSDLRAVDVQIQEFSQCKVSVVTDEKTQICAYLMDQDFCDGDSGVPLMLGEEQVGIASYGTGDCGKKPSIYIYVVPFRGWIKDITGV